LDEGRGVNTGIQFVKFLFVGLLNTLFGYAVFAALIYAGMPAMPALVLTYVTGVLFNFVTTGRLVFSRSRGTLARFIAAYVVIYFFNLALFKTVEAFGAGPLVAQALCLPVVAVFSFLLLKFQVFRDRP
jgi:putative flippase GtrA